MNINQIKSLAKIMREADLNVIEVQDGESKVRLERTLTVSPSVSPSALPPAALPEMAGFAVPETASGPQIFSPMVGVFYRAPSPESDPFVDVGTRVSKGDVVCIIEAMKLMNEIVTEQDGVIADILVENGGVVQFGDPLFTLR